MGDVQVAYLFIYFQIAVTTSKYNIIEQYTFLPKRKKREEEEKLFTPPYLHQTSFSEVAHE